MLPTWTPKRHLSPPKAAFTDAPMYTGRPRPVNAWRRPAGHRGDSGSDLRDCDGNGVGRSNGVGERRRDSKAAGGFLRSFRWPFEGFADSLGELKGLLKMNEILGLYPVCICVPCPSAFKSIFSRSYGTSGFWVAVCGAFTVQSMLSYLWSGIS